MAKFNIFDATAYLILTSLVVAASGSKPKKILLLPAPHYGHVNFFSVAAQTLKEEGHDVTILVQERQVKRVMKENVDYWPYALSLEADVPYQMGHIISDVSAMDRNVFHKGYYLYQKSASGVDKLCRELLGNYKLMQKINDAKFDLVIVDSLPPVSCLFIIPYKFDIPYVTIGAFNQPWRVGVSSFPPHELPQFLPQPTKQTTLTQRALSTVTTILSEYYIPLVFSSSLVTEFVPDKPYKSIKQMTKDTQMTLVTTDIICFDFPKVGAPNYQFIGSLSSAVKAAPLVDDFKRFADEASEGLIVVSFGSMIGLRRSIVNHIHMLIEALGQMKEKAILQFALSDLGDTKIPDNIFITEWLPQYDLLGHPNTKLFIAHGGINGQLEATYFGIPILTLPFQKEQERNGARAEAKGYGRLLRWGSTNAEELYQTIQELINNGTYKENIGKCASILKDMPKSSEQLAFWVSHVLKYGGEHLRPLAADMPFYQFFGLDVFAVFILFPVIFSLITLMSCNFCWKKCRGTDLKHKRD